MKLENGEIFTAVNALNDLYEKEWPVRVSLALAKLSRKLQEPFKAIEQVREGLLKKHGTVDEKGGTSIKPEDENWSKFAEDFNELMSQTTELVFDKVKLPEEVDGKPVVIKPSLLVPLEKFIEIEEGR